uniref:Uncharacterized protein n=1 Tax=Heterorhabditis bacteriophora TaxID=37862 RepID=A0A1I7WX13_HETBA
MDIEDLSDSVDSSPIDLSTKGIERGIFEDKSRLFLASLSSPQHLLSLCAQLAANRDTSKETIVSAPEARAPQIESQIEEERNICCVASGCEQSRPEWGHNSREAARKKKWRSKNEKSQQR